MQLTDAPVQIQLPFGNGDVTKTVPFPVPSQIGITPGKASFTDGFPPLNGTPVSGGGVPPFKTDMNGLLYTISAVDLWMSAGAGFKWSSPYSTAIGGYPKGARVLNAAGNGYWRNLADNNTTNPDGIGSSNWMAEWRAVSSVYASAQQTLASGIAKITWDTIEYDDFGLWDATDKVFKAVWAGKYRLSGVVYLPAPAAQNLMVQVSLNGSAYKQAFQMPQVSNVDLTLPFDVIVNVGKLDTVQADLVSTASVLAGQVGSNAAYVYGQFEFLGS